MTQEEIMNWFEGAMAFAIWVLAMLGCVMIVGFIAGYTTETIAYSRSPACINSACDNKQCPEKFKCHVGECTK